MIIISFITLSLCSIGSVAGVWQENILPKLRISKLNDADIQKFIGNSSHSDHFKLLESDGNVLLVGARNIVYNLSLSDLQENKVRNF